MLKYALPDFYSKLLPQSLLNLKLSETKATCQACLMTPERAPRSKIQYQEGLKCCTFEPFLPNYLVGAILKSDLPGKKIIQDKIKRHEYSLPIGMVASVRFQVEFNARKETDFGNRKDWLCPYYNQKQNNCGIWRYRGVVCTSFFCKSSYGKNGLKFWDQFSQYLSLAEMGLLEEALVHLDFSPRQISDQLGYINRKEGSQAELRSWVMPEKTARKIWQDRFDSQEEFYIKCFEFVQNMTRKDLQITLGTLGQNLVEESLAIAQSLKLE